MKDTASKNIFQYKPLPFQGIVPPDGSGKKMIESVPLRRLLAELDVVFVCGDFLALKI